MSEKYYSTAEIEKILGISKWTLREWLKAGKIKGTKIGKQWRVSQESLQAFLQEQHG